LGVDLPVIITSRSGELKCYETLHAEFSVSVMLCRIGSFELTFAISFTEILTRSKKKLNGKLRILQRLSYPEGWECSPFLFIASAIAYPQSPRRFILSATIRNPETVRSMHDRACIIIRHPEIVRDMHYYIVSMPLACRPLKETVSRIVCEKKDNEPWMW